MNELERKELMDFGGVVLVAFDVAAHEALNGAPINVGSRQRAGVEQDFSNIRRERIPIPDSEVIELVSSEEEAFGPGKRQRVIDAGQPLRHPVVVCVFRLEREFKKTAHRGRGQTSATSTQTAIGSDPSKRLAAFGNQP